jgi:ATP-dependent Clp protease protease subunit
MDTWYRISKARVGNGFDATVDIMDEIGSWGVTAKQFADDLKALGPVQNIMVRITSPGGDYFMAAAMFNMLKATGARITVEIIGLAASAASFIAMAGDHVRIARNAFIMIHGPSTFAIGDEKEMRKAIEMLAKVKEALVAAYVKKTGMDKEAVEALVNAETWFTAEEALDAGFADEIIEEMAIAASFDVRRYSRTVPTAAVEILTRHNNTESEMTTKSNAGAETPEQMEARIREEVTTKLKTEQDNATAAATAAAAETAKVVVKSEDDVRAEMASIIDACALAGLPAKASEYIAAKKTLTEVMADLKKVVAAAAEEDGTNAHNSVGVGGTTNVLGVDTSKGLDTTAAYAKFNRTGDHRARH